MRRVRFGILVASSLALCILIASSFLRKLNGVGWNFFFCGDTVTIHVLFDHVDAMSYNFSTVHGVLPLGTHRAYIPRAARPHLVWSTAQPSRMLGSQCRLKGDGTAAREEPRTLRDAEAESGEGVVTPSSASALGLAGLLTTDTASGTRISLYSDPAEPQIPQQSTAIPTQRRVVAVWTPPTCTSSDIANCAEVCAMVPLFVSDDTGSVFAYQWGNSDIPSSPAQKRRRTDGNTDSFLREDHEGRWTSIAPAHSTLSCEGAGVQSSCTSANSNLFTVTRGAPGWAGLTALHSSSYSAALQLVSVREFHHDVRLIDPTQQTVLRTYSTTHAPTGVFCPSMQAAPHCTLIVEGCLVTLYDVRCPSAVVSLGEVYEAQAELRAAKDVAAMESHQQGCSDERANGKRSSDASAVPATLPIPPLVPGRLTSTVGQVRDVCGTVNPFEVACAVDRALCVYDLRKFNRLFTSSSVLKYVIGGVASAAGGRAVVCSGIDAEVRLVPLHDKDVTTTSETLSLAARVDIQAQEKKKQRSKAAGEADTDAAGPGGTFRTRLSTSVSCTSVWQGGWVSACNADGAVAVGVSIDGEVFLAQ